MSKNAVIISVIILIVVVAGGWYLLFANKNTVLESQTQQNEQQAEQPLSTYDIQGMKVEILKEGSGEASKTGDLVTVDYTGTLQDGTKFDSSIDRGQPFSFTLGQNRVIQGWELGVLGMKKGEKRRLTIPPELAYGESGAGGMIPGNATLTFVVDMIDISTAEGK